MVSRFYYDVVTAHVVTVHTCIHFSRSFLFNALQFNDENPAGNVVESDTYLNFLAIKVGFGFIVATKRFWVGLFLGRQTFCKYIHTPALETVIRAIICSHKLTLNYDVCSAVRC
jgi:hypothetical protein